MSRAVLILGATSPIARALALEFAAKGHSLYLAARDREELERVSADLAVRHPAVIQTGYFNGDELEDHASFCREVLRKVGELEGVVVAFGDMGHREKWLYDDHEVAQIITRNFTGAATLLTLCAHSLEKRGNGFIVAISSVAGDRGRQSNYPYGAAKAGLNVFLQGMRNRLYPHGVRVLTVKPGFVDTRMTFGKEGIFLAASPERVARAIVKALRWGRHEIYVPWFWRWIMAIIKLVPESLFKRLKL